MIKRLFSSHRQPPRTSTAVPDPRDVRTAGREPAPMPRMRWY
jgi:hypothetical protein